MALDTQLSDGIEQEASRFYAEFMMLLRKNWWLIGLICGAMTVASVFYSLGQTKIYQATATVQIDPSAPKPLGGDVQNVSDLGTGISWNTKEYYQTQYEILQSRKIALQTVRRLGLHRDASFVYNQPAGFPVPEGFEPNEEIARIALQGRLNVSPVKDSRLIKVTIDDAEPERAKRVLQALVEIYIDENVDGALESTKAAAEWLSVQLDKLRAELGQNELALHDFKKEKRLLSVSMDDQNNMLRDEMEQLNHELTRVRTAYEEVKSRYDQLTTVNADDPIHLPAQELLESSVLQRLRTDYITSKKAHAALLESGKGAKHPATLAAGSTVALSKEALLAEVVNIREALRGRLQARKAEATALNSLFQRAKAHALELNRMGLDYHRLERAKVNTEKVYSLVLERSKESDITRYMRFNNIRVLDPALVGSAPVAPRTHINVAIGGLLGLCLGLVAAFARSLLDRTFRSSREMEEMLRLTVLGCLPRSGSAEKMSRRERQRGEGNELVVHTKPTSAAAEAARALRTSLMFAAPDRTQRRLLVTSGGPTDGKTTVACWVACALAQTGKRILLIDCDLRRPRIHKIFGRTNDVGVSTMLLDDTASSDSELATVVPNLFVITAGPAVPNPAELLQSDRFEQRLAALGERFDQIVIDSPPVAAVTDATVLSTKVDGVILVVRAHSTRRDVANQAARTLKSVSKNILGVVMNDLDTSRDVYGSYQYQYYYRKNDDAA